VCAGLLRWFRGHFAHEPGLDLARINIETRFTEDLGTDSLDYMCWPIEAEEKLGVAIPDREAELLVTVGHFLRWLRMHGASWAGNKEIRLVQKGNCWKPYVWQVVPRTPES